MSAGAKVIAFYESNLLGLIMPVEVDEQTLEFTIGGTANTGNAGPATLDLRAQARKPKRALGVGCRLVRFQWDDGQVPTGYKGDSVLVPIMTTALFDSATDGAAATYLGGTGTIKSQLPETKK